MYYIIWIIPLQNQLFSTHAFTFKSWTCICPWNENFYFDDFFILLGKILARLTVKLELVSKSFTFGPDDEIYRTLLVPLWNRFRNNLLRLWAVIGCSANGPGAISAVFRWENNIAIEGVVFSWRVDEVLELFVSCLTETNTSQLLVVKVCSITVYTTYIRIRQHWSTLSSPAKQLRSVFRNARILHRVYLNFCCSAIFKIQTYEYLVYIHFKS